MNNGKWLVTTLTGSKEEMGKIMELVESGKIDCFTVED